MSDLPPSTELDLGQEALLYLADELEPPRRDAFEKRLESDEAAQTQLALAVELSELLRSKPPRPDPAYRDAVRLAVLPPRRSRSWLGVRLWAEFGIAICLLFGTWSVARIDPPSEPPTSDITFADVEPGAAAELADGEEIEGRIDMAAAWAEMSNLEHYQQYNNEDDQRRKPRPRETGQLLIPALMGEFGAALE
jgi:hypothetical protein